MFRILGTVCLLWFSVAAQVRPTIGEVIRLDPAMDKLIPPGAKIEVLASGFEWAEGRSGSNRAAIFCFPTFHAIRL